MMNQQKSGTKSPIPELSGEERRRYWKALGWLFIFGMFAVSVSAVLGMILGPTIWLFFIGGPDLATSEWTRVWKTGNESPEYSYIFDSMLYFGIIGIVLGGIAINALWRRLFIRSGYLTQTAAARLLANRAPTARGERWRVSVGYVVYLAIFGGTAFLAFRYEYWLVGILSTVLSVSLLWHAWRRYKHGFWTKKNH